MALGPLAFPLPQVGMTAVFDEETGAQIPCTLIGFTEGSNYVTQVKTEATDGYHAVQVGYGECHPGKLSKPELGHLAKGRAPPLRHLQEYRVPYNPENTVLKPGLELSAKTLFAEGERVDVQGDSIGKGFQGNIKRHGFKRGLMTHGSKSHREHGSTGPGATPSRVYPGVKHPGRMGGKTTTVQNLKILKVEENYVAVEGSVPGKKGNLLSITKAKGGYSPN